MQLYHLTAWTQGNICFILPQCNELNQEGGWCSCVGGLQSRHVLHQLVLKSPPEQLLLNLVLLEGQQLLLLLLLSCQQLLQRYQLLLLLGEGNQLLGVAHSQGAAQETCQGGLLGAGGQVGGVYAWAVQTPESCLDLLHL